jgi:hypothetical protein
VPLESLRTAEPPVALITLVERGMSCGVEVLVEGLLAAKGPVIIIALVYWRVGWAIEVLVAYRHRRGLQTGDSGLARSCQR